MPNEDSLQQYRDLRDLDQTPEPYDEGHAPAPDQPRFVVHQHDGQEGRHFDLRLEADGVLKSWTVPSGPPQATGEVQEAHRLEDHPLSYGEFEGVVPEGNHGQGPAILWDSGTYQLLADEDWDEESESMREAHVVRALQQGDLTIRVDAAKLKGDFRMRRRGEAGGSPRGERWVIEKLRDEHSDPEEDPRETQPASVQSGLTLEELKATGHETGDEAVEEGP